MSKPAPERIQQLLLAALQQPPSQRAAFLQAMAGDSPYLLQEVQELLDLHPRAESFMAKPLAHILNQLAGGEDLAPGLLLRDRYRLLERVSVSGFASVYFAADELLEGRKVAVKVIDRFPDDELLQTVLKAEVSALSRVHHPKVVGITDIGETPAGKPFVILTYVPGETLRAVINTGVTHTRARSLLAGIGRALSAAHKAGVWHLDIKPENVIVTEPGGRDERVTLIDFGIARLKELSGAGINAHTPAYHAPEQSTSPGLHTDVYLLSLLAFELFTGTLPSPNIPIEQQLPKSIGSRAAKAITAGLQPLPAARPASIDDLVEELCANDVPRVSLTAKGVAVALAMALLLVLGLLYWRPARVPGTFYELPVPLAITQEREHRPTFSANGKHIYYEIGPTTQEDIYRKPSAGGPPVLIVGGPADESWPVVSPDESTLIFNRAANGVSQIVRKSLPDGPERIVAEDMEFAGGSFSLDGDRAILSSRRPPGPSMFQVLTLATNRLETIDIERDSACGLKHPRVSPDGNTLAFACTWTQGRDDLYSVPLKSKLQPAGRAARLTFNGERVDALDWAPDSKSILFVAGPLGSGVIKRLYPGAKREAEIVPVPAERVEFLTVPRHEFKIAYSKDLSVTNIWALSLDGERSSRHIVSTSYSDERPRYSPDGKTFIVSSVRSGIPEIWLYSADGSNGRRVFATPRSETGDCLWTPGHSDEIVCSTVSPQAGRQILRGTVNGGVLEPILSGYNAISFSIDGKWMYILERNGDHRRIHRVSYPSLQEFHLVVDGAYHGEESPDGSAFYYSLQNSAKGLWKIPLPSGQPVQVIGQMRRRDSFAFAHDGILFVAAVDESPDLHLVLMPYDGRPQRRLFTFAHDLGWGLSLSPDQRTLLYSQIDSTNADILLVDHFR